MTGRLSSNLEEAPQREAGQASVADSQASVADSQGPNGSQVRMGRHPDGHISAPRASQARNGMDSQSLRTATHTFLEQKATVTHSATAYNTCCKHIDLL